MSMVKITHSIVAALVLSSTALTAWALETTAQSPTQEITNIKRVVNEKVIGLTAVVEALGTQLYAVQNELSDRLDQLEAELAECAAKGALYNPKAPAGNRCIDIATTTAAATSTAANAPCKAPGSITTEVWSTYYGNKVQSGGKLTFSGNTPAPHGGLSSVSGSTPSLYGGKGQGSNSATLSISLYCENGKYTRAHSISGSGESYTSGGGNHEDKYTQGSGSATCEDADTCKVGVWGHVNQSGYWVELEGLPLEP